MTTCIVIYQTEDTDHPVIARNLIRTFAVLQYIQSIHCASEQSDQTIPRPSIYPKVPTCIDYINRTTKAQISLRYHRSHSIVFESKEQ